MEENQCKGAWHAIKKQDDFSEKRYGVPIKALKYSKIQPAITFLCMHISPNYIGDFYTYSGSPKNEKNKIKSEFITYLTPLLRSKFWKGNLFLEISFKYL